MENTKKVKCPQCKSLAEYSTDNPDRPFCSERCRLFDLGDWASNSFHVKSEEEPSPEELENAFLEKLKTETSN